MERGRLSGARRPLRLGLSQRHRARGLRARPAEGAAGGARRRPAEMARDFAARFGCRFELFEDAARAVAAGAVRRARRAGAATFWRSPKPACAMAWLPEGGGRRRGRCARRGCRLRRSGGAEALGARRSRSRQTPVCRSAGRRGARPPRPRAVREALAGNDLGRSSSIAARRLCWLQARLAFAVRADPSRPGDRRHRRDRVAGLARRPSRRRRRAPGAT